MGRRDGEGAASDKLMEAKKAMADMDRLGLGGNKKDAGGSGREEGTRRDWPEHRGFVFEQRVNRRRSRSRSGSNCGGIQRAKVRV